MVCVLQVQLFAKLAESFLHLPEYIVWVTEHMSQHGDEIGERIGVFVALVVLVEGAEVFLANLVRRGFVLQIVAHGSQLVLLVFLHREAGESLLLIVKRARLYSCNGNSHLLWGVVELDLALRESVCEFFQTVCVLYLMV